jgi:hypothetical protein
VYAYLDVVSVAAWRHSTGYACTEASVRLPKFSHMREHIKQFKKTEMLSKQMTVI